MTVGDVGVVHNNGEPQPVKSSVPDQWQAYAEQEATDTISRNAGIRGSPFTNSGESCMMTIRVWCSPSCLHFLLHVLRNAANSLLAPSAAFHRDLPSHH